MRPEPEIPQQPCYWKKTSAQVYSTPTNMAAPPPVYTIQPQPTIVNVMAFDRYPMNLNCPHCKKNITTALFYREGALTWLCVGGLCIVGLCCFVCVPCCVDDLKDVELCLMAPCFLPASMGMALPAETAFLGPSIESTPYSDKCDFTAVTSTSSGNRNLRVNDLKFPR
ncbi:hypothetical protein WR25_20982 [Diploscapter pachys]|uniref:LITAF domain-containing protein n=1 Tax=Diploscapter pachys TaxID=2018661 RepID=A0A2A2K4T5_9BILA|nr:hypothetical protein WR25_20982 [Diploscapter pachys]